MLDVIIVGGGISGLHSAVQLAKQGRHVKVLEARERLGGRIHSKPSKYIATGGADIGPSWFWPGQMGIENLIRELSLESHVFAQFDQGDSLYEPLTGAIQRGIAGMSMAGSYRIGGGLSVVIDALRQRLEPNQIELDARVLRIEKTADGCKVHYGKGRSLFAKNVVIALPPRVAVNSIIFSPELSESRKIELNETATWMAGHAKAVVLYDTPFWKQSGLSGDVFSQKGPLSEIHDASSFDGEVHALFGFFQTEPPHREHDKVKLDQAVTTQLARIFEQRALTPLQILYKDWAKDDLVATQLDQQIATHHQISRISDSIVELNWNSQLIWSGTEMASGRFNGYIEGAINASEATIAALNATS